MAGNRYLDAIDRFLELAEIQRATGGRCHSSPVSLRFVKASKAYLAPQSGRDTCMVEIIFGKGTIGANEMIYFYETELYRYGARPHWGQLNYVTGGHAGLEEDVSAVRQLARNLQEVQHESPFRQRVRQARRDRRL